MAEFLKCPKCGGESFTEWSRELCSQSGVRIDEKGEPNYDDAMTDEISGLESKVDGYDCDDCDANFDLVDGKLVECEIPS